MLARDKLEGPPPGLNNWIPVKGGSLGLYRGYVGVIWDYIRVYKVKV